MTDPVTGDRLSDERLIWLAVREHLRKRPDIPTARTGFGEVFSFVFRMWTRIWSRIKVPEEAREARSNRMAHLAIIVDDLSARLTPHERHALRQTGAIPDWFLPAVDAEYARRRA